MRRLSEVAEQARYQAIQPAAVTERHALDAALAATPDQPEQILLTRRAADPQRTWWLGCYCSASADTHIAPVCSFWPIRDQDSGSGWYVKEIAYDAKGNPWERSYCATVDDFGNLVEVAP